MTRAEVEELRAEIGNRLLVHGDGQTGDVLARASVALAVLRDLLPVDEVVGDREHEPGPV